MTQALRESEDALIRLCKQALRRRLQSGLCTKPPAYALSYVQSPSRSLSETPCGLPEEERSASSRALLDMYKNQLQELAQRSCFNLPSYGCLREGPDHAPRFKATVRFNNEVFEGPGFCSTLRQAEHAVAEVALQELSKRGPTQSLAAKMLDETGVCKNLLQETAQKAGVPLPVYSSNRTGPGHLPVYICTVNVGGRKYVGQSAKTKKQAEKNAAAAAWAALKKSQNVAESESDEQAQTAVVKALLTAPPEGDSELPSTSAEGFLFHEHVSLPREPLRTSRLFGGVTSTRPLWQGAEYGLPLKPLEGAKAEVAVGAERAGGGADVAEGSGAADRVGLPPAPAPFDLFSAAPMREWISPAEAKQAKVPASPSGLAPLVVPRTLQVVYGAKPGDDDVSDHAKPDEDDLSDYESPTAKVLGVLKKDRPFE